MEKFCIICGEDDQRVLKECHHIFGKSNSPEKVLLCYNCHLKITKKQNELPPSIRKKNTSKILKRIYAIRSFGSLLEVWIKQLTKFSEETIEELEKCQK